MKSESGFTLIELLTVIGIIGIVAALGSTSFYVYRSDAAYAVAESLVQNTITAFEAATSAPDAALPSIGSVVQNTPGEIVDAAAREVFPGTMIPRKVKVEFSHDPTCADGTCELASATASHCQSREHIQWIRYGDGLDVRLENVSGGGCS